MTKNEFLAQLRKGLSGLREADMAGQLSFYSEMIEDRIEEGLSEEEAVSAVGSVEEIIAQINKDTPLQKNTNRRLKVWEIVFLVLGSPIWLSLGIAVIAVMVSRYISVWAIIIALWTVFVSLAACSFGAVAAGVVFACSGKVLSGAAIIAGGILCAGLSIFMFYGCKAVTKGILALTKICFIKKGDTQ